MHPSNNGSSGGQSGATGSVFRLGAPQARYIETPAAIAVAAPSFTGTSRCLWSYGVIGLKYAISGVEMASI